MIDARSPIDEARGVSDPYLRKLTGLAFLAPDIQRSILEGRQPAGLRLADLVLRELPLCWNAQRELLGFA
jgi:site-specific DNA recombinase